MSGFVKAGFSFLKNLGKGQKTTGTGAINKVNISKNLKEFQKHKEDIIKSTDKHGKGLTEEGKIKVKTTVAPALSKLSKLTQKLPEKKAKGGRVGLKFGGGADMGSKKLSPKQMKIAKLAGNKKKIDAPDFKKLRAMKSPMDKQVRQKAAFGGGADMGKVASDKTKAEVKKYEKRAKDASKFLKNKNRSFGSIMREKYMR